MRPGDYDQDAAKRQIELSSPDVRMYVERLLDDIKAATAEIIRLRDVVKAHTTRASGRVVGYHDMQEPITAIDMSGMRTLVRLVPQTREFYLAEPLAGYSQDHRRAFHRQVVDGFAHAWADDIARSIWSAQVPQ